MPQNRRGTQGKRDRLAELSEDEQEIHGLHATVNRDEYDKIIPVAIPPEVVDCFRNWGDGHWGESKINLDNKTVHMNQTSVAQMTPDTIQSVLKSLMRMAGLTFDPANNTSESTYTGYIHTPDLKVPDNEAETGNMQVFDGEVVENCVSPFETSAPVRKQIVPIALAHLIDTLTAQKLVVQDKVMIKVIMEDLLRAIPNPEAVARKKQQDQNHLMKDIQRGMKTFRSYAKQAGEEVAKNKQIMANEEERERMFQETLELHKEYTEQCKHVMRADETAKLLGPAIKKMNDDLKKIFSQIDIFTSAVPVSLTGAPPHANESTTVLRRKRNEILVRMSTNEATQTKAREVNEQLMLKFQSVGSELKEINALYGSEGWAKTKYELTAKKHKQIAGMEREILVQGHILEEAKSEKNMSRFEQAMTHLSSIFTGFGQIGNASRFHENDANDAGSGSAADHHGEGSSSTRDHTLGKSTKKRKADKADQVEGGGAAAKGARRSSRRGQ
jgi:hypothetical protein